MDLSRATAAAVALSSARLIAGRGYSDSRDPATSPDQARAQAGADPQLAAATATTTA